MHVLFVGGAKNGFSVDVVDNLRELQYYKPDGYGDYIVEKYYIYSIGLDTRLGVISSMSLNEALTMVLLFYKEYATKYQYVAPKSADVVSKSVAEQLREPFRG